MPEWLSWITAGTDVDGWGAYMASFGALAFIVAMLATLLQACFPFVPFFVVAGANVLVFGLWQGMAMTYAMTVLGALLAFVMARSGARGFVQRRVERSARLARLNRMLEQHGFAAVLLGRLLFVVPSIAVNWISGLSSMRFSHFLFATLLGKLPVVILESMLGHDLMHWSEHKGRFLLLFALFIAVTAAGRMIHKRLMAKEAP